MSEDNRTKFLIQMYGELFNDINRHIVVVWQSVSVLVGAFAVFALVEKKVINLDIAASLMVVISGWLFAHLVDAGYWYNRNLAIISNIERQFLVPSDLRDIHYYFGKHRPNNKMLTHLQIQFALGAGILLILLVFHLTDRVLPGLREPISEFELQRALPYVLTAGAVWALCKFRKKRREDYQEFLGNSPGKSVDSGGVRYGPGHGFTKDDGT